MRGLWVFLAAVLSASGAAACITPPSDMPDRADRWKDAETGVVWRVEMIGRTGRYGHSIMGGLSDSEGLMLTTSGVVPKPCPAIMSLPRSRVVEDIAPRLVDVTGDGRPEVVTVISSRAGGARLAVLNLALEPIALGPEIGLGFRWLAIAGIGDFNADGAIDIAYVETPHLGKTLRFWTVRDGALAELANRAGLTNHRIGEEAITSAVRSCGDTDQVVLVSADWSRIVAASIVADGVETQNLGPYTGPGSLQAAALTCE